MSSTVALLEGVLLPEAIISALRVVAIDPFLPTPPLPLYVTVGLVLSMFLCFEKKVTNDGFFNEELQLIWFSI